MTDTPKPTIEERIAENVRLFILESRETFEKVSASLKNVSESLASLERVVESHQKRRDGLAG